MKHVFLFFIILVSVHVFAQQDSTINLPNPEIKGGMPLMEALNNRKTARSFQKGEVSKQLLSNLLWAACGVNRENGKRTAPTALNWQEIDVIVSIKDGLFWYDAQNNQLKLIKTGDYRNDMGKQAFTKDAAINLVYVADYSKMEDADEKEKDFYSATDTGFISQNVYLFCASENLSTVVLGYIDREKMSELLELNNNQKIILSQSIGFPKK